MPLPHDHHQPLESLGEPIPATEDFAVVSRLFRHLGDPTRIRIFWLLCHGEECVINLAALMGMSSPAVAHHLRLLREAGLITSRKEGKEVYYTASLEADAQALHHMIEDLMEISCPK